MIGLVRAIPLGATSPSLSIYILPERKGSHDKLHWAEVVTLNLTPMINFLTFERESPSDESFASDSNAISAKLNWSENSLVSIRRRKNFATLCLHIQHQSTIYRGPRSIREYLQIRLQITGHEPTFLRAQLASWSDILRGMEITPLARESILI